MNFNKTEKLEFRQNSTKRMKNFKNSNCDKIQQLKLWKNSTTQNSKSQILIKRIFFDKSLLLRKTWHLDNQQDVIEAAICNLAMFNSGAGFSFIGSYLQRDYQHFKRLIFILSAHFEFWCQKIFTLWIRFYSAELGIGNTISLIGNA